MKNFRFIRYIEFGDLFELFFFSAILTIIAIRIFLQFTGFPQIGSGVFHIAHLIFGGFFMLFSILGFITFLNEDLKSYWAILGGMGFGTFIDEIGKYITRDNNYFYQPTFAIIYVVFIILYLIYKNIERDQNFTKEEYLINSINILEEYELKRFDKEEKREALEYLSKSDQNNFITKFLFKIFKESTNLPEPNPGKYEIAKKKLKKIYRYFLKQPWSEYAISSFFIARSFIYLVTGIFLIISITQHFLSGTLASFLTPRGLLPLIQFTFLALQAILTIVGAITIAKSRKMAYRFFRGAVLVSVFVLQVFNFYSNPVHALFSTIGDLLLLGALTYMSGEEK